MTQKTVALITGANKGLGLEIARQLGQRGWVVVLGARDEAKGAAAVAASWPKRSSRKCLRRAMRPASSSNGKG